jgi:hypothetical protein
MHRKAEEEVIAVPMGDDENAARRRLGGAEVERPDQGGTGPGDTGRVSQRSV